MKPSNVIFNKHALARESGLSLSTVRRFFKSHGKNHKIDTAQRLAATAGLSLEVFMLMVEELSTDGS